ncbi:aspartate dehydrogenase [Phaeobacter marinintestinus]|uniref:aspartate dehydrogenase n=1 Tax=Falsiphaeobacter marinintestinus TaxID=1492905 RepID=UPI0011B3E88A|nr:aspartate dehydrogenase [Phaeobacter marinintestinus]
MKFGLIGNGAIATYVRHGLEQRGHQLGALLLRPERVAEPDAEQSVPRVAAISDLPADLDLMIDCAGHVALRDHGPGLLRSGRDLVTVSIGAMADQQVADELLQAAGEGGATLHLASGAIGGLDVLRAANAGTLTSVRYVGRKPPKGWVGSRAEDLLDLAAITDRPETHFTGSARQAALAYPKNANVAAAVALAGIGFDRTQVELIADPGVSANIHEVQATGDFGRFDIRIAGQALPGNPRSSALAAMSVISTVEQIVSPMRF